MIVYKHLADGAFVGGDTDTGITGYAYPTSEHAEEVRKNPLRVASEMVRGQIGYPNSPLCKGYNAANWELLNN